MCNSVTVKNGRNVNDFELSFRSRWSRDKILEETKNGTIFWIKSTKFAIRAIYTDGKVTNESPRQIIFTNSSAPNRTKNRLGIPVGTNEEGSSQVKNILQGDYFSYPKPVSLIGYLISLLDSDLVLDFFAGSGTTAHAVMALNAEDGGNRKCISVQLPEPTPENSPARQAGFNTISEITRERIRRAGKKILEEESEKLSTRETPLDVGFRAYKLTDTHFAKWRADSSQSKEELTLAIENAADSTHDNVDHDALLAEILLKSGFSLTEQVEQTEIEGLEVYNVGDGLLLAYLDEKVKPSLKQLRALVSCEPSRLVILEDVFNADDQLKTNLVQECRTYNVDLWTL